MAKLEGGLLLSHLLVGAMSKTALEESQVNPEFSTRLAKRLKQAQARYDRLGRAVEKLTETKK